MNERFLADPWRLIETRFDKEGRRLSESLFATGNGAMGLRGNFEEGYSGDSLKGTYVGGVWFPDKTRVGWWKIGYPAYFGKVINAMDLISLDIRLNGERLDLDTWQVGDYRQTLDMKQGLLSRVFTARKGDLALEVVAERFVSMADKRLMALSFSLTAQVDGTLSVASRLDGDVHNQDANYEERFWLNRGGGTDSDRGLNSLMQRTKPNPFGTPQFSVAAVAHTRCGLPTKGAEVTELKTALLYEGPVKKGDTVVIQKQVMVYTDRDHDEETLKRLVALTDKPAFPGYDQARAAHIQAWADKWARADVEISGDDKAQQGIRYSLFQLLSTYTGDDPGLNIGPKGFTGEKYGGATYWDTEAYCLPVYLAVAGEDVAGQLLRYRYLQLDGAYHNARQQGLAGALYPMVTFNGIECHNEWEITFEEIHRNAAIAWAIFHVSRYTGDDSYAMGDGFLVLMGIARFFAGRGHWHQTTGKYMIHGVTGPNEYENNVNNNWYTNRMAAFVMDYFVTLAERQDAARLQDLGVTLEELSDMRHKVARMYYPYDPDRDIFVQHDTFLDKHLMKADDLPASDRPLNQNWSWDRILRSCFIKQADTLQGLYFLGHLYSVEDKRRHFDFYEPMTVHESSLSPCVHAILACEIGAHDKAVALYHRAARLDLDNINNDTDDGLHITSMSGSWLVIAQGFAGMRTAEGLSFDPFLPQGWTRYAFTVNYRGRVIKLSVDDQGTSLTLEAGEPITFMVSGREVTLTDKAFVPGAAK